MINEPGRILLTRRFDSENGGWRALPATILDEEKGKK
jgi:hypothetical protein